MSLGNWAMPIFLPNMVGRFLFDLSWAPRPPTHHTEFSFMSPKDSAVVDGGADGPEDCCAIHDWGCGYGSTGFVVTGFGSLTIDMEDLNCEILFFIAFEIFINKGAEKDFICKISIFQLVGEISFSTSKLSISPVHR